MTIFRHEHRATESLFIYLLIAQAFVGCTMLRDISKVSGGTYAAIINKPDFLIFGVDTRISERGGGIRDNYCKILPLGDKMAFLSIGASIAGDNKGHTIFDSNMIAAQTYRVGQSIADTAQRWGSRSAEELTKFSQASGWKAEDQRNQIGVIGVFGGIDTDDNVRLIEENVAYINREAKFVQEQIPIEPAPKAFVVFYAAEVGDRFFASDASKMIARFVNLPEVTRYAMQLQYLIQFAIVKSGDPGIGGEPAVLMIERGKGRRWFRRPDFCAEK